jgi:hypothetical protein
MLSLFILGAGFAGTFSASDASTARGRLTYSAAPGQTTTIAGGLDLATAAVARLGLADRHLAFSFGYSPSYTVPGIPEQGFDGQLFQSVDAGVTWHGRRVSLFLGDSASYGTYNSAYNFQPGAQLPGAMTAPGSAPGTPGGMTPTTSLLLAPKPVTVTYLSNRTNAAIGYAPGGRTTFSVAGSYGLSGGLGTASQAQIPLQRGIESDAAVSYAIGPGDFTRTGLSVQDIALLGAPCLTASGMIVPAMIVNGMTVPAPICRPDTQSLTLGESYSHSFDAATVLSIGGGPEVTRSRSGDARLSNGCAERACSGRCDAG